MKTAIDSGLFKHASTATKRWEEEEKKEINGINGVTDTINEITNSKPEFTSIRVLERTADTVKIGATAIDRDNENLTYTLYFGENKEDLQNRESIENIQGEEVTWTVSGLNETKKYFYRIDVKDRFVTVSSEVKELRVSPHITSTEIEKTTNSATIKVVGKGEEDLELTYDLYIGKTEEDMEKTQTKTGMSEDEISFEELNLEEYTDYYYRIELTDGTEIDNGTVQNFRTYCPGTGLECSGGVKCTACNGTGKCLSTSFLYTNLNSSKFKCRSCKAVPYTSVFAEVTCRTCGADISKYVPSASRPQLGACYRCTSCGYVEGSENGHGTCATCRGSKYKEPCSEHGKYEAHEYCSHGETTQHDT